MDRRDAATILLVAAIVTATGFGGVAVAEDFLSGFFEAPQEADWNATDGPQVTVAGQHNFSNGNPFTDTSFTVKTENHGDVTFSSESSTQYQPAARIHVDDIEGSWTNVTELNVTDVALKVDPSDKQAVRVGGDTDTLAFQRMQVDDGNTDFVYNGSDGGATNVTVYDLSVTENTLVAAVDQADGTTLSTGYVQSDGSVTLNGLEQSEHAVSLETTPAEMNVYNESAPETLINDRELTAEFYDLDGDKIFEKSTTTGVFDLSGIDKSEFAVRLADSQGDYASRQVIIKDVTVQRDAWMLNTNGTVQTVSPTFVIEDETGNYDPTSSRVFIQRGLNISNTTTYKTIGAEEVGTDGYTETIEADQRYRIIVENQKGDRRVLGKFSAADSQTYTLTVEELTFDLTADSDAVSWGFNHTEVENSADKVNFRYQDLEQKTTNLDVVIYERGNKSNELHNASYAGPLGNLSITEPVPSGDENAEWTVEWNADRDTNDLGSKWSDGPLGSVPLPTSERLLHTMAVGFILLVGGLASKVNAPAVGFATASTAGIAYYIGWLPGSVAGGMIALAFLVPVLYLVDSEGIR